MKMITRLLRYFSLIGGIFSISVFGLVFLAFTQEPSSSAEQPCTAGTALPLPSSQPGMCAYLVRKGDTLIAIAKRLTGKRDNYKTLIQVNALTAERIRIGDRLLMPKALLRPECQCEQSPTPTTVLTSLPECALTPQPKKSDRIIYAELEGLVFADANGIRDEGEPGIPEVKLILVNDHRVQNSDANGKVVFKEVEPGPQAVGLDETSLPAGSRLSTSATVLITVTEGDKGHVKFGVQP